MNMHLMLTLADASQVDASAHVGSMLLVGALLMLSIAGALKCIGIATRPEAHTLCALSLALVLVALAGTACVALSNYYTPPNSTVKLAVALITWFMAAVAFVLAIVGLVDYRSRRPQLEQGAVQGWLALGLTTAKLIFVGWAIWGGVSRANSRRDASTAQAAPAADAAEISIVIPSRPTSAGTTERFRSLNFSFTPPNEQWAKLHAQLVRRDATTSYTHGSPKTIFVVVAERVGAERGVTIDRLVELVTTQLVAPGADVKFGPKQPVTIGGVPGVQFEATVGTGIYAKKSIYWLAAHGGFAYQLITEGGAGDARLLAERHTEMIAGFALNDSKLVAHVGGVRSVPDFASEHYGYRLDLSRDAWHTWPSGSAEFPAAQFKAAFRNQAAIGVVPIYLPEMETSLDELGAVLTRTLVQDIDLALRTEVKSISTGDDSVTFGYQAEARPGVQREFRIRIVRRDRRAFMIAAWADDPSDELIAAIDRAMEGFEIQPSFERSNAVGSVEQKAWRGLVLSELGLVALRRRELEIGRVCFEEALKLHPVSNEFLENLVLTLVELGRHEQALAALDARPAVEMSDGQRVLKAKLLGKMGRLDESRKVLEDLFREGYGNEDELLSLIELHLETDDVDAALAAVDAFLTFRRSPSVKRWKGQLLIRKGDHQAAIDLLTDLHESHPDDMPVLVDLADAYASADQFETALQLTQPLVDAGKTSETLHLIRGQCQLGLKFHKEAKESFELALAVNPRSEAAQNWVTLASGMLGQGNTTPIKTPIEPVAIPPEIQQRLAEIPVDDSLGATHGAYEIYRITGFDFAVGKHWKTTVYRKAKIIGPQGVERYRSLSVTFNSLFERVYVNRLAVYDETGALAAEGNPNDYYVVDNADGEMATGEQTLYIPAPMIKPGYTLEYELTRELLVGLDSFGFERVVLAASLPTQVAAVFVVGDVDKLAFTSTGPEAREGASGPLRYWGVSNPPLYAYESAQPAIEGFLPIVHLSDVGRTWQELGAKYCEKIADRLQPDAAAVDRAVQITAGLATREEKVAAIARFVQKEINYQALEFGVRGQMPNAPSRTLETAYGDCKDHSLLAKQMLDAVGIPSQLALVHSANLTDRQLPSQDQFDHMILSVPGPAGGDEGRVFLDCTSKHHHPGFVIFSDSETAINEALLLDPINSRLVGIPCRQADWVELRCNREVTIACDHPESQAADAVVREQVWFSPVAAGGMRAGLSATEPREHKSVITEMLRDQEKIRLTALSIENLDEPALPLVLNLEYRVESVFHKIDGDGGKFVGRLPAVWESWLANDDDAAERVTPFRRQGATLRSTSRVILPPGYVASRAFEPQRSPEQNRFVAWTLDGDPAAHSRSLTIQSFPGVFPSTDYALSCREMKQLTDFLQKPITIEPAAR